MGPIRYPETSVEDYHSTLRNIVEKRWFQRRDTSLNSTDTLVFIMYKQCVLLEVGIKAINIVYVTFILQKILAYWQPIDKHNFLFFRRGGVGGGKGREA
jgi:hypothetical protein